jgi:hypothetical protein
VSGITSNLGEPILHHENKLNNPKYPEDGRHMYKTTSRNLQRQAEKYSKQSRRKPKMQRRLGGFNKKRWLRKIEEEVLRFECNRKPTGMDSWLAYLEGCHRIGRKPMKVPAPVFSAWKIKSRAASGKRRMSQFLS